MHALHWRRTDLSAPPFSLYPPSSCSKPETAEMLLITYSTTPQDLESIPTSSCKRHQSCQERADVSRVEGNPYPEVCNMKGKQLEQSGAQVLEKTLKGAKEKLQMEREMKSKKH